jgi:hypothetical protein
MAYRLKTVRAILAQAQLTAARKWARRGSLAVPGVIWTARDAKGNIVSRRRSLSDPPRSQPPVPVQAAPLDDPLRPACR